jgi:RND family efflux transporter MFP subunit
MLLQTINSNLKMKNSNNPLISKMKTNIIPLFLGALLSGCGAGETADNSDLSILTARRDSLKTAKDNLSQQISILEQQIAELDTMRALQVVSTASVQRGTFAHTFEVYGELNTDQNAQIVAEMGGLVTTIHVQEGQQVQKGQILVSLDTRALREQEQELQTRLELAETTFRKQEKLWKDKIGSEMQFLQAKNNRDALQNSLESLRAQIAKGNISAPFNGIVDEVFPKIGEVAMPGLPVARVVNLGNLYITADLSENYIGKVRVGDKVKVSFPATGKSGYAAITRTGDYVNPNNRTFKIKASVANEDGLLKPNMVARMEVQDFLADSAIIIPQTLIMEGSGNTKFVYVVDKSNTGAIARKRVVSVDRIFKGEAMITEGLAGNEELVNKGARSIRDGENIEIKNEIK